MNLGNLGVGFGRIIDPAVHLSGLAFRHDPSLSSSITLNGSDVAAIADQSVNARHASQGAAANQPARTAAGINGLDVITYTGANSDSLALASATEVARNVSGFTLFAVVKPSSLAAINRVWAILGATGSPRFNAFVQLTTGRMSVQSRRLDTDATVSSVSTTAVLSAGVAAFCLWMVNYATGVATLRVNSTTQDIAITWTGGNGNTSDTAASAAPSYGAATAVYNGAMGEAAAYSRVLTSDEIEGLRSYCADKWGTG